MITTNMKKITLSMLLATSLVTAAVAMEERDPDSVTALNTGGGTAGAGSSDVPSSLPTYSSPDIKPDNLAKRFCQALRMSDLRSTHHILDLIECLSPEGKAAASALVNKEMSEKVYRDRSYGDVLAERDGGISLLPRINALFGTNALNYGVQPYSFFLTNPAGVLGSLEGLDYSSPENVNYAEVVLCGVQHFLEYGWHDIRIAEKGFCLYNSRVSTLPLHLLLKANFTAEQKKKLNAVLKGLKLPDGRPLVEAVAEDLDALTRFPDLNLLKGEHGVTPLMVLALKDPIQCIEVLRAWARDGHAVMKHLYENTNFGFSAQTILDLRRDHGLRHCSIADIVAYANGPIEALRSTPQGFNIPIEHVKHMLKFNFVRQMNRINEGLWRDLTSFPFASRTETDSIETLCNLLYNDLGKLDPELVGGFGEKFLNADGSTVPMWAALFKELDRLNPTDASKKPIVRYLKFLKVNNFLKGNPTVLGRTLTGGSVFGPAEITGEDYKEVLGMLAESVSWSARSTVSALAKATAPAVEKPTEGLGDMDDMDGEVTLAPPRRTFNFSDTDSSDDEREGASPQEIFSNGLKKIVKCFATSEGEDQAQRFAGLAGLTFIKQVRGAINPEDLGTLNTVLSEFFKAMPTFAPETLKTSNGGAIPDEDLVVFLEA